MLFPRYNECQYKALIIIYNMFSSEQIAQIVQFERLMTDEKLDRRVQRTRELLQRALMQLIDEKGYDAITINDITERANLGRTTFYLHYQNKDDLMLDHHANFAQHMSIASMTYEQIMSDEPLAQSVTFLRRLEQGRAIYLSIIEAKDADMMMQAVHEQVAENLAQNLERVFNTKTPKIPLDVLTRYIIGAQLSLVDWWMRKRTTHDADDIARQLHHMQRAIICDAYGIRYDT